MGLSAYANYGRKAEGMKAPCASKRGWYGCPSFNHDRTWLPDLVKQRRCSMTYMTPPVLRNITGRPILKILLHGDSLFKGLYKSFLCQLNEFVDWERHYVFPRKESHTAEVWIASLGSMLLQYNYRDGGKTRMNLDLVPADLDAKSRQSLVSVGFRIPLGK